MEEEKQAVRDETEGRETEGRETEGRETEGRETEGRETAGRETEGRETAGRETAGRETAGRETVGRETVGRETAEGEGGNGDRESGQEGMQPQTDLKDVRRTDNGESRSVVPLLKKLGSLTLCFVFTVVIWTRYIPIDLVLIGKLPFTMPDLQARLRSWQLAYALCLPPGYIAFACLRYLLTGLNIHWAGWGRGAAIAVRAVIVGALVVFGLGLMVASFVPFTEGVEIKLKTLPLPYVGEYQRVYSSLSPLRSVHSYGLFRRMTGVGGRPELVIQGSKDRKQWKDYTFPYKPQAVDRNSVYNIPHQPRLDWQMWFAALTDTPNSVWVFSLTQKLFSGSESVLTLFSDPPFASSPPDYLRIQLYSYNFTVIPSHPWSKSKGKPRFIEDLWSLKVPNDTWTRRYQKDWLPELSFQSEEIVRVYKQIGVMEPRVARKRKVMVPQLHYFPLLPALTAVLTVWGGVRTLKYCSGLRKKTIVR